jgi:putative tricarboxylic transport membrane protein
VFVTLVRRITSIPQGVILATVPMFCLIGAYVNNGSMFDVGLMLVFGVLGYVLNKLKISLPTMIVAFFLGSLLEHKIRQSLSISRNDWTIFIDRPIACAFLVLTVFTIAFFMYRHIRNRGGRSITSQFSD